MNDLLKGIGRLSTPKKVVLAGLSLVVVLTWLGVCLVLGTYLGP